MRGRKGLVAGVIAVVCLGVATAAWIVVTQAHLEPRPTEYRAEWNNGKTVEVVTVDEPVPHGRITNPLVVRGKVAGSWFFEANFPIVVLDEHRHAIGVGFGVARGDWMTEKPVKFTASVKLKDTDGDRGFVVLHRANPSDDRTLDAKVEIPIRFP